MSEEEKTTETAADAAPAADEGGETKEEESTAHFEPVVSSIPKQMPAMLLLFVVLSLL